MEALAEALNSLLQKAFFYVPVLFELILSAQGRLASLQDSSGNLIWREVAESEAQR